jgi:toxin FitB
VKWLLDTDVISETVRERPNRNVIEWLDEQPPADTAISLITLGELRHGVLLAPNENRQTELAAWIDDQLLAWFAGRILPVTLDIVIFWLEMTRVLSARRLTRAPADLLIAATAKFHGLKIATRNSRDFAGTGVIVYNPWTGETHNMEAP